MATRSVKSLVRKDATDSRSAGGCRKGEGAALSGLNRPSIRSIASWGHKTKGLGEEGWKGLFCLIEEETAWEGSKSLIDFLWGEKGAFSDSYQVK